MTDCKLQAMLQAMPEENVIAKDHAHSITAYKFLTQNKGLRESIRIWLDYVRQPHAKLAAIPEKFLKTRQVRRR
jgi:hypothetical protein